MHEYDQGRGDDCCSHLRAAFAGEWDEGLEGEGQVICEVLYSLPDCGVP